MTDEITVIVSLKYTKSGIDGITRANPIVAGDSLTQKTANVRYVNRVQNIGAAAEVIGLGDVTVPGMGWYHNVGVTDTIEIRNGVAGADVVSLELGEWALFRTAISAVLWAISISGTNDLEYFIIED